MVLADNPASAPRPPLAKICRNGPWQLAARHAPQAGGDPEAQPWRSRRATRRDGFRREDGSTRGWHRNGWAHCFVCLRDVDGPGVLASSRVRADEGSRAVALAQRRGSTKVLAISHREGKPRIRRHRKKQACLSSVLSTFSTEMNGQTGACRQGTRGENVPNMRRRDNGFSAARRRGELGSAGASAPVCRIVIRRPIARLQGSTVATCRVWRRRYL